MASQRIYLVSGPTGIRLVKASVASQAISHVAKSEFSAKVASQDDLVEALGDSIKVENYSNDQEQA
jgi:hypothetical protein